MMDALKGSTEMRLVDVTPRKKQLEEIHTKKAKTGGFIHTHHFNDNSTPEKHLSPTAKLAGRHVAKHFGGLVRGAEPTPDEASGANETAQPSAPMAEVPQQGV